MKVSCLQENLSAGLSVVQRAAASYSTMPVLSNVLIQARESHLKFTSTDLELMITCQVGANVEEEGSITVPVRLLRDLVYRLPPERVDLFLERQTLVLKCDVFESHINGISGSEFPVVPIFPQDCMELEVGGLCGMIEQVCVAAATDIIRPALTGILVDFVKGGFRLVAADGFRLVVCGRFVADVEHHLLVPARTLLEVSRVIKSSKVESIKLAEDEGRRIFFKIGNVAMVSQLIEGNFPDYAQIVPQTSNTRVLVDTGRFLTAVKVAAIFARDGRDIVKLTINPGYVTVAATSAEMGNQLGEVKAEVEQDVEGDGATVIGFNSKYLIDVLQTARVDKVSMGVTTSDAPVLFSAQDWLHVVMPINISGDG